jgi:hypothetical protein
MATELIIVFRVNYDKENWKLIGEALIEDHTAIHVINRAQVQLKNIQYISYIKIYQFPK